MLFSKLVEKFTQHKMPLPPSSCDFRVPSRLMLTSHTSVACCPSSLHSNKVHRLSNVLLVLSRHLLVSYKSITTPAHLKEPYLASNDIVAVARCLTLPNL